MTIYIQHGHGKSDKIPNAIDDGSVGGLIIAARNEKVEKLDACLNHLTESYDDLDILFDPQFFVSALSPANDRFLEEYPYYKPARAAADFIGSKKVAAYAKETIDFQNGRAFTRITTPSVLVRSFADRWAQIALQLADASIDYHDSLSSPAPLLLKIMLSENALDNRDELDAFLNVLTTWDVQGFYLIIARDDASYSQTIDPDRMAHLLYIIYVLGDRNGYEVICGYCDFIGIACMAAGATAFGNGWYQSLRQFHVKSFLKHKPGGGRALLRYSSAPLLNSIRLSELESIFDAGHLDQVLSNVDLDKTIREAASPEASDWNATLSERHHWQTLASLDGNLSGEVRRDMADLVRSVRKSQGLFTLLQAEGVPFDRSTQQGQQYKDWLQGLQRFVSIAGV